MKTVRVKFYDEKGQWIYKREFESRTAASEWARRVLAVGAITQGRKPDSFTLVE